MSTSASASVISFEARRAQAAPRRDPTRLLDAVDAAGPLLVRADDRPAKAVAIILSGFGFLTIEEIEPDGRVRRLAPGQLRTASPRNPWRLSRAERDVSEAGEIVPA